jgi:hypothetical protein
MCGTELAGGQIRLEPGCMVKPALLLVTGVLIIVVTSTLNMSPQATSTSIGSAPAETATSVGKGAVQSSGVTATANAENTHGGDWPWRIIPLLGVVFMTAVVANFRIYPVLLILR